MNDTEGRKFQIDQEFRKGQIDLFTSSIVLKDRAFDKCTCSRKKLPDLMKELISKIDEPESADIVGRINALNGVSGIDEDRIKYYIRQVSETVSEWFEDEGEFDSELEQSKSALKAAIRAAKYVDHFVKCMRDQEPESLIRSVS